jgi:hypothetical protein
MSALTPIGEPREAASGDVIFIMACRSFATLRRVGD